MKVSERDVQDIFAEAILKEDADERRSFLERACGQNRDLREEVENLLRGHGDAGDFLECPPGGDLALLDASPLTEGPGSVIGPYELVEKIGEGGMAVVYMAEQKSPLARRVALKVIKLGMDTNEVIARFEAERQALAMMDHPNIAKVLDAGTTDSGRPYFVMELVRGVSITEHCDQHRLDTRERLELLIPVCNAVHHAHQKGIIHRDLKPSNIMVTLHDGKPVPKVIDFGVAKATNRGLAGRTLFTGRAEIIGTPEYMSPEQAEAGGLDIDTRTDIYSLGVVLYELLTGALPFDSKTLRRAALAEIQRIIREVEPPRPSTRLTSLGREAQEIAERRRTDVATLTRRLHRELEWIPLKALRKDRTRRYASASEFAQDIENYLNAVPLIAGPESSGYLLRKWTKRHRALVTLVTSVAATLMIGLVVSIMLYVRAEAARQEAQAVTDFLTQELLAAVTPERAKNTEVTVRYLLDTWSRGLEDKFAGDPLTEAEIRETLGRTYRKLGDYSSAEPHLRRALQIRLERQGERHLATANAMNLLGSLYFAQGRYDEGTPLLASALDLRKRILGENHPDTLESMRSMAMKYICTVSQEEAMQLITEVVTRGQRVLGEEHPVVLKAMMNLSGFHVLAGQYEKAEPYADRGSEISRRVLGADDALTLEYMKLATWIKLGMGRYADAEKIAREALESCNRVLGEEHPLTYGLMNHLGTATLMQGRTKEAARLLTESVERANRVSGKEDLWTIFYSTQLAMLYREQERFEEMENLLIPLLEPCRRKNRKGHPLTNNVSSKLQTRLDELISLGNQQYDADDYEGVVETYRRSGAIRMALYGNPTPWEMSRRAIALREMGRDQEARKQLVELRAMYKDGQHAYEAEALHLAERRFAIEDSPVQEAWEFVEAGELDKAFTIVKRLLNQTDSHTKPDTSVLRESLARAYCAQAACAEINREYAEAHTGYINATQASPNAAVPLQKLAWFRATCPDSKCRDGSEAIELATQACDLTQWKNLDCLEALAASHAEADDFAAAVKWQKKAIDCLPADAHRGLRTTSEKRLDLYQSKRPYHISNTQSLIAHWTFDQVTGREVIDASGNGRHGKLVDSARVADDKERGKVLILDGEGYVDCGTDAAFDITGPFTVTAWIRAEKQSSRTDLAVISNGVWWLRHRRHDKWLSFYAGGLQAEQDATELKIDLSADELWHHVVVVYDGLRVSVYFDGNRSVSSGVGGVLNISDDPLYIGASTASSNWRWEGAIDDVRLYDYALNKADIQALYDGTEVVLNDE